MTLYDAFGERKRRDVLKETWGHLAPELGRKYTGWILVAHDCYGGWTILDWEFENVPSSPWIAEDIDDFTFGWFDLMDVDDDFPVGVYRYEGWYKKFKNGGYQFQAKPFVQQTIVNP